MLPLTARDTLIRSSNLFLSPLALLAHCQNPALNGPGGAHRLGDQPKQPSQWRALVSASRTIENNCMPLDIRKEWADLQAMLKRSSFVDGRKRLNFSLDQTPHPLPEHEIEPGLPTFDVHVRADDGSIFCKWLRKLDRTPLRVKFLWPSGKGILLHMATKDAEKLVRTYGRNACTARIFVLRVVHPQTGEEIGRIRAKPLIVNMTADRAFSVENLDFIFCPHDRIMRVDVPVRLVNDDKAPGVKDGGWIQLFRRTIQYQAFGKHIPPFVALDIGHLKLNQTIQVQDMPVPPGCRLPKSKISETNVLRCTTSMSETS